MSDSENMSGPEKTTPETQQAATGGGSLGRGIVITLVWVTGLLTVAGAGLWWYSNTASFQRRAGRAVVKVLEDATGGRAELRAIHLSLWSLAVEVDGLTIHGLEGPGEAPYLAADKILVRVKLNNFIAHIRGAAGASAVGLKLLRVEHPQFHLMVDKDGRTNQPTPKHPAKSEKPALDTLLDLKAEEVAAVNGVFRLNDRAIPFDLAAKQLNAQVRYIGKTDRYGIALGLDDLATKMGKNAEAQSKLKLEGELGRDVAELKSFEFDSGTASALHATGALNHFAQPSWQGAADGSLELTQIGLLTGAEGLTGGSIGLDVKAHSCAVTPVEAQTHPKFWQRKLSSPPPKPGAQPLPPDPECAAGYLVVGDAKFHDAGYENPGVRLRGINGGAQLHITPAQLLLTSVIADLPGGGRAAGELRITNWLGEAPAVAAKSASMATAVNTANKTASSIGAKPTAHMPTVAPVAQSHASVVATVTKVPLRTIMEVTEVGGYGDLGLDTAVTGPVTVEWDGSAADSAATVQVGATLQFTPTGAVRKGALNNVPVTGQAIAKYDGKRQVVTINRVELHTPGSVVEANGILGVSDGDPLTNLKADVTVHDLGEFDQLLTTLDLEAQGKKGRAAIPAELHGTAIFHGTVSGPAADLDAKGHLEAEQVELKLEPALHTQVDALVTDAEFSPSTGLTVASSTIKRGTAVLNLSGKIEPHKTGPGKGASSYLWDDETKLDATMQLANANLTDLLQIAGKQEKVSVTGKIASHAHVAGTLGHLDGQGDVALKSGVAYGEPYDSATASLAIHGKQLEASQVALVFHGVSITGNGGYDFDSKHLHGHVQGKNLVLSKFTTIAQADPGIDGSLDLVVDANGTMEEPGLKATATLAGVNAGGKELGDVSADLHSEGSVLYYTAKSLLIGAKVDATGQTQLNGGFETQAKMTLSGFDMGTALSLFGHTGLRAQSSIGGTVTVNGPLKTLTALNGSAELNECDIKLEGVELKNAGPLRASLKNGIATLEQFHITGQDTDLTASGTAQVFGATGKAGGKLDVQAKGSASVAMAHTFDPDLLASGKVEFSIAAGGGTRDPSLTGRVQFDNINAAIDGVPNGLSGLNGTLVFNEDRLQVESLTASTGGGQLKIGGFLTYRNGVYADLTATGDTVRVRLYGLSATANTNLRLQGSLQSAQLTGTVLVTRFGVGPTVDFAAFAGAGGVSATPDPNSAANKIQLNVRVTSSPQLDFQNTYAKLAGTVDLTARGTVANPTILGRIQITDGSATFAGTKYQLQRGDVYFTNPVRIDPTIDLDATARVETYDITVGLHGTSSNLKPTYRSEPPLSEADIFALLALGRTQEEAQLYQEQQVQQGTDPTTSALLGGALNATVSNRVGKLFGGGSVKIDPAFVGTLGNSSARITVQQQLSRQLSVTYATNVNSTAQQLLQGQYDLTPNASLVVTRDESGVFSVVYKIRKRYR
jgi:translocation and assembly module TamB